MRRPLYGFEIFDIAKLDLHAQSKFLSKRSNEVYVEWAAFLNSVRKSLKHFRFEQVPKVVAPTWLFPSAFSGIACVNTLLLDVDFFESIFPVLMDETDWPRLKTLDIQGVNPLEHRCDVGEQLRKKCDRGLEWVLRWIFI